MTTLAASTWDAWTATLPQWTSSTLKRKSIDPEITKALTAAISSAATTFQPTSGGLRLPACEAGVPLHQQLEAAAKFQLQAYLELDSEPNLKLLSYTTTDLNAAVQIAGVIASGKKGKSAVISIVAQETERLASWSRLEGLNLHWACAQEATPDKWQLPPRGFKVVPNKTIDAGGAWQSGFDKQAVPGDQNSAVFTLVLQVPLEGPLEKGGLVFVLKSASTGNNTKWLKDSDTQKDFFLDVNSFPVIQK